MNAARLMGPKLPVRLVSTVCVQAAAQAVGKFRHTAAATEGGQQQCAILGGDWVPMSTSLRS